MHFYNHIIISSMSFSHIPGQVQQQHLIAPFMTINWAWKCSANTPHLTVTSWAIWEKHYYLQVITQLCKRSSIPLLLQIYKCKIQKSKPLLGVHQAVDQRENILEISTSLDVINFLFYPTPQRDFVLKLKRKILMLSSMTIWLFQTIWPNSDNSKNGKKTTSWKW